jgi:hypothetical protein
VKFDPGNGAIVGRLGGQGGEPAQFCPAPHHRRPLGQGTVYVADTANKRVQRVLIVD